MRRARAGESGFTLLEVLIALAVFAVGAALTLSLVSGSLAKIRKVQVRTRTIQHAQTVLELALLDESVKQPTTLQGDFEDGTRWMVHVTDYEIPLPPPPNMQPVQMPVKLLAYTVEVVSPGSANPEFRLQTLKMISALETNSPMRLNRR
jgi:general secretion pathway protein I